MLIKLIVLNDIMIQILSLRTISDMPKNKYYLVNLAMVFYSLLVSPLSGLTGNFANFNLLSNSGIIGTPIANSN